jgi:diacylglycerol O-acyltransferase
VLGAIPTAVQALLGPIASALPIPVGNIICTQVPGPREALYLMGHRMLSCYPYVPLGGEFGMNCAVLTYNDTAHFGFSGDAHAIPDLHVLPKYLLESFEELRRASGVKTPRPRRQVSRAPGPPAAMPERKPPDKVVAEKVMTAIAGD